MDGSQVTAVVSVVGGVVGLIALTVAWSQMRIASAKTKLDLYTKRFNVYLAALEYFQYAYSDNRVDLKQKAEKLTLAYRETKFLFDSKDGIYDTLGKIQKGASIVKAYDEYRRESKFDVDRESILAKRNGDALISMAEDLLVLERKLGKYLSFHNVRGWTFF